MKKPALFTINRELSVINSGNSIRLYREIANRLGLAPSEVEERKEDDKIIYVTKNAKDDYKLDMAASFINANYEDGEEKQEEVRASQVCHDNINDAITGIEYDELRLSAQASRRLRFVKFIINNTHGNLNEPIIEKEMFAKFLEHEKR